MLHTPKNDQHRNIDLPLAFLTNLRSHIPFDVHSILYRVQERRIQEITPAWVESLTFKWNGSDLHVDIKLASRPPHGTVLPFLSQLEELCGGELTRTISPGIALLKDTKPKTENVSSRDHYRKIIEHTLPYGVEINHLRHYKEQIGREAIEFLIPHLRGMDENQEVVEQWRQDIERDYGIEVYPMVDWVSGSLRRILKDKFGGKHAKRISLSRKDIPKMRELIGKFHSPVRGPVSPHPDWRLDLSKLVDLTGSEFAWVTMDPPDTRDREDAVCARMLPDGKIEAYIALCDPTEFAYPGSSEDALVQQRGVSLYGRRLTVPTLSHRAAYNLGSFLPGKVRRAVVAKFVFEDDGTPVSDKPEVLWANVKCVGNIPPEDVYSVVSADMSIQDIKDSLSTFATSEQASQARISLYWMAQVAPALKSLVGQKRGPQKMKGEGLGHQIVQYSMQVFKHSVACFLRERGYDFIANNQGVKDAKLLEVLATEFKEHGLSFDPQHLDNPTTFKEVHQLLVDRKLYRLRDKLLYGRIGKTTFSPISRGKQLMKLDEYANFKARMSDGLTNIQIVVALLNDLPPPYSFDKLLDRARNAERKNNAMSALCARLHVFESILFRLGQIGTEYAFTVESFQNGKIDIRVEGNNHRCVFNSSSGDVTGVTAARLVEYVIDENEDYYVFEPVYGRRKFAA